MPIKIRPMNSKDDKNVVARRGQYIKGLGLKAPGQYERTVFCFS